jgi:hypothetical protein
MYKNNKYDMVNSIFLDYLVEEGKIKKFLRSQGWVVVGVDSIRGMGGSYDGPERRELTVYH